MAYSCDAFTGDQRERLRKERLKRERPERDQKERDQRVRLERDQRETRDQRVRLQRDQTKHAAMLHSTYVHKHYPCQKDIISEKEKVKVKCDCFLSNLFLQICINIIRLLLSYFCKHPRQKWRHKKFYQIQIPILIHPNFDSLLIRKF